MVYKIICKKKYSRFKCTTNKKKKQKSVHVGVLWLMVRCIPKMFQNGIWVSNCDEIFLCGKKYIFYYYIGGDTLKGWHFFSAA